MMTDHAMDRAVRLWPVVFSTVILVGTAFVVRQDVSQTKANVEVLSHTLMDHEKRLIRVEEAAKNISEMKDDLKQLNAFLMRRMNRPER